MPFAAMVLVLRVPRVLAVGALVPPWLGVRRWPIPPHPLPVPRWPPLAVSTRCSPGPGRRG